MRLFPTLVAMTALLVASTDVASAPPRRTARVHPESRPQFSSVGAVNAGRLQAGEHLDESEVLRVLPALSYRDSRWGVPELIHGLERAARFVDRRYPSSMLTIGDISRKGGGEIGHHKSHQSGRDADVGFYMVDTSGRPFYAQRFLSFQGDGTSPQHKGVKFDDGRNWALIEALLTDGGLRVQKIFVSGPLRQRILREAERRGVSLPVRLRAAEVLQQPRAGVPHDDHFHVRVACPSGQENCEQEPRGTGRKPRGPTPQIAHRPRGGA